MFRFRRKALSECRSTFSSWLLISGCVQLILLQLNIGPVQSLVCGYGRTSPHAPCHGCDPGPRVRRGTACSLDCSSAQKSGRFLQVKPVWAVSDDSGLSLRLHTVYDVLLRVDASLFSNT